MKLKNLLFLTAAMLFSAQVVSAATIRGKVLDGTTGEPLLGATVMVKGTTTGTATSFDGSFELAVQSNAELVVSYISYLTQEITAAKGLDNLMIKLAPDTQMLASVEVVTKANLETEANLQNERIASHVAIENLGVKEMSLKGISNVQDGVKKMTGISVAESGQLVVRGLGDRYSITTLNGQPIASPNPDTKLIPLDIFPSSTVQNITVSKVYDAASYADYAGAHIDIATKNYVRDDFFTIGFSVGGNLNTIGRDFYKMDNVSLFTSSKINSAAADKTQSFSTVASQGDPFETTMNVNKTTALPSFGGKVAWGHTYDVGEQELSLLASFGASNDLSTEKDSWFSIYEAGGTVTDSYSYDSYKSELKMAGLVNAGITLREKDRISYTLFYARNAEDKYMLVNGFDQDGHKLTNSVDVTHIYKLMTSQLNGHHVLSDKFDLNWSGGYTRTSSDEPDRRQSLYEHLEDGRQVFYDVSANGTMRFFGELQEDEINANVSTNYKFLDKQKAMVGLSYRTKSRDYSTSRYYYSNLPDGEVTDIYNIDDVIGYNNYLAGDYSVTRSILDKDQYSAENSVIAGYVATDLALNEALNVNVGVRMEMYDQSVNYYSNGFRTGTLESLDLFPTINAKYNFDKKKQLRLSGSRTVTRPSFIEMAPFLYQEAFGSVQLMGNAELENGYNYNVDLRYELFFEKGDMFSLTGYYKALETPIERIQSVSGGGQIDTFENAESGLAAGVEFELRKTLFENCRISLNGSYMYTNVNLTNGGSYTNKERSLQGASPYLVNADLTYTPTFGENRALSLALLYNLQGPRIHTVGTAGRGDIIQQAVNTLNFNTTYRLTEKLDLSLQLKNLLNLEDRYMQELSGVEHQVESHKYGIGADLGVSYKF
ncbi:MAG: TonB-dependent receptor [Rikenellaceae bacterium]